MDDGVSGAGLGADSGDVDRHSASVRDAAQNGAAETDYGYSLVVRLHEGGFTELAEGTVYPALARAEQAGWIDAVLVPSEKGPARKYYGITPAGDAERRRARGAWERLAQLVDGFAGASGHPDSKEK